MTKTRPILDAIIAELRERPESNPSSKLQLRFQITRETARRYFQKLIDQGVIEAHGYGKARVYSLVKSDLNSVSVLATVSDLAQLGESEFYAQKIEPHLKAQLNAVLSARAAYVATECLNNVIDHSLANTVTVAVNVDHENLILRIADDGIGALAKLKSFFNLTDNVEAISELAKGKRTTDASSHAGEGLFFSSRIADNFRLTSNGISYIYVDEQDDWAIAKPELVVPGTEIVARFKIHSEKTTKSVFDRFTSNFKFDLRSPRLVNPYELALPPGNLISRSEAKKLFAGAEDFKSIIFDFKHVEMIGQGFAHEVFVVFASKHPNIQIEHKNANEFVLKMIRHVTKS